MTPLELMRRKKGYRQADMERLTSIPQPRYSRIERGVQQPTSDEREKIKKVLLNGKRK